ncbi:MAG: CCA tRNA nucleotidyltransferase [Alphaproteobacteria bacterium]
MNRLEPYWLNDPAVRRLLAALNAANIESRFVGGCVRDSLLGLEIGDIDVATPAVPDAVMAALRKAKIRAIPTGLAHGTVTAVIPPRHFEITTLRRDVETYGRRAKVAFDAGWDEDAARRDFTINAIYLAPDGTIYDPVAGRVNLAAHRVRFVGDPGIRIAEDVLRILRYYRFEARFGSGDGDPDARAACRAAIGLLPTLSAERVARELMRLLGSPEPVRALRLIEEDGVLAALLPEAKHIGRLERLVRLSDDPILRLAALIDVDADGARAMAERLRLSNAERDRLAGLAAPWPIDPDGDPKAQRLALYRLGPERYCDLVRLAVADGRMSPRRLNELLEFAESWPIPIVPLGGADVAALGIAPGPRTGKLLAEIKRWWEDGDFTADRAACLARLKELAARP